jgi:MFS transporter, putative metabolite:H+ symporter
MDLDESESNRVTQGRVPGGRSAYDTLEDAIDRIGMNSVHLKILLIAACGGLFNVIEQYNIGYAAPLLAQQWDLSGGSLAWLSSATFLAMAVGSVVSGVYADRIGRKPLFIINILVYSVGALIAALAPNYEVLLLARIIVGFGLGGEMALGYTLVAEFIPRRQRAASSATMSLMHGGVGIWAASLLAALVLGPVAAALGYPEYAWRILLGIMVLPAILALVARRGMPETPRFLLRAHRIGELNRTLSAIEKRRIRLAAGDTGTSFISEADAPHNPEKVRFRDLFRRKLLRQNIIASTLATTLFAGVASLTIYVPTVLVSLGYAAGSAAGISTLITFGGLLGGVIGIVVGHRVPRRMVLAGCALGSAVALTFLTLERTTVLVVVLGFAVALALQVFSGSFWGYLPELYPTRVRALGVSFATTVGLVLGASLGPLLAGSLFDSFGPSAMFAALSGVTVVMLAAALLGPETHRRALLED